MCPTLTSMSLPGASPPPPGGPAWPVWHEGRYDVGRVARGGSRAARGAGNECPGEDGGVAVKGEWGGERGARRRAEKHSPVTLLEVARLAGVSLTTASKAINGKD